MSLAFRARIRLRGVNPYVLISENMVAQLAPDKRGPIPVRIRVNGKPDLPWHINMVPRGDGAFYLYLSGTVRKAAGTQVGDRVDLEVEFDPGYRRGPVHPVPPGLSEGLGRSTLAHQAWEQLPESRKKELIRYLVTLKSGEARQRNIERALFVLGGGRARFLGREWNAPAEPASRPVGTAGGSRRIPSSEKSHAREIQKSADSDT